MLQMDLSILQNEMNMNTAIPRPIPTMGMPKMPTTISATTTSSSNSNTKLTARPSKPMSIGPCSPRSNTSSPDPNKPIINPVTNRKSYDHIGDRELRKKLKNRESAQAARDRKKAKMLALERQLSDMAERNKILENENRELRGRLQRIEADAFWRLVKNPGEGGMEGNPAMAAMMNQGMHPNQAAQMAQAVQAQAAHANMMGEAQQHPEMAQHIQMAEQQKQLYQRQMQFLLEGNPAAAAAFHQGQIQQQNQQSAQAMMPSIDRATLSPIESLSSINYNTLRGLTKGEPMDDDPLPDLPSPSDDGRHPSISSESPPVNAEGLDDWILRNFKTDSSPLAGSSPDPKSGGSTGYSSAGCESPDGDNGNPASPNTMQENIKSLESIPINWTANNRSASSDSGAFSDCNFAATVTKAAFAFKNEKN